MLSKVLAGAQEMYLFNFSEVRGTRREWWKNWLKSGPRCQSAQNLHLHQPSRQPTFCKFLPKSGKQRLVFCLLLLCWKMTLLQREYLLCLPSKMSLSMPSTYISSVAYIFDHETDLGDCIARVCSLSCSLCGHVARLSVKQKAYHKLPSQLWNATT